MRLCPSVHVYSHLDGQGDPANDDHHDDDAYQCFDKREGRQFFILHEFSLLMTYISLPFLSLRR